MIGLPGLVQALQLESGSVELVLWAQASHPTDINDAVLQVFSTCE